MPAARQDRQTQLHNGLIQGGMRPSMITRYYGLVQFKTPSGATYTLSDDDMHRPRDCPECRKQQTSPTQ
jgi:hypothetical protein